MLKLKEEIRDEIVKIVANSSIPTKDGVAIINELNRLEKIEKLPTKDTK